MTDIQEKARQIRLAIFDVDGVLTDGQLYYGPDGMEIKAFHSRDGHGLKMLQQTGVDVAIITARTSEAVKQRMSGLGIRHVFQGQQDKTKSLHLLLERLDLRAEEVAYTGDDVIDLPVMTQVGLAIAVQDANELVKRHAHWITPHCGGKGAARDVCELLMEAQGTLNSVLQEYLA
ncbi:MAG: 3-deoxy-manno-octulosonate-8-phosphatase KdsC [Gammaproteobacteria bacterium]|nr:MAG: 3-deoxy-manno-octulosonate-8-phosphatase KdsC [Gammaproteobacteria bacterium]